jgi:hypothetical protein
VARERFPALVAQFLARKASVGVVAKRASPHDDTSSSDEDENLTVVLSDSSSSLSSSSSSSSPSSSNLAPLSRNAVAAAEFQPISLTV